MSHAEAADFKAGAAASPREEPKGSAEMLKLRGQGQTSAADATAREAKSLRNRWTQTTRYLSAAAYRNGRFRDRALRETLWRPYRAIAPNYGIDLATVLNHCRRAKRRLLLRNLLLTLSLLTPFALGGADFYVDFFYVLGLPEYIPSLLEYYPGEILAGLGIAFLIVFVTNFRTEHTIAAKKFSRTGFETAGSGDDAEASSEQPDATARKVAEAEADNLTVYGGYSPFVGAGFDHGGWSFAVNVKSGRQGVTGAAAPKAFAVRDLYGRIEQNLKSLQFVDLTIEDKLFVSGENIREFRGLIGGDYSRPTGHVAPEVIADYVEHPTDMVRHYKCIQRLDWDGELIVSVFLRLFKTEDYLYAEANYFLAPPLRSEFYAIDKLPQNLTLQRITQLLLGSVITAPVLWVLSPFLLGYAALHPVLRWQERRNERIQIRNNRRFNYGALVSVRDLAASGQYREFFQKLDKEMNAKFIEKEILDTVINYLDAHDIDTSELRDRQTTILNNGVIMSGGSIKAQSLSMGSGARATLNRLRGKSGKS